MGGERVRFVLALLFSVSTLAMAQEKVTLPENRFERADSALSPMSVIRWLQGRRELVKRIPLHRALAFSIEGQTYILRFDSIHSGTSQPEALLEMSLKTSDSSRWFRLLRYPASGSEYRGRTKDSTFRVASWLIPVSTKLNARIPSREWGWEFRRHTLAITLASIKKLHSGPVAVVRLVYSDKVDWSSVESR